MAEHPDLPDRLAEVERTLPYQGAKIAALECKGDWQAWQAAVLDAIAKLDSLRSMRICGDCGA